MVNVPWGSSQALSFRYVMEREERCGYTAYVLDIAAEYTPGGDGIEEPPWGDGWDVWARVALVETSDGEPEIAVGAEFKMTRTESDRVEQYACLMAESDVPGEN